MKNEIKLKILGAKEGTRATTDAGPRADLVYAAAYEEGDVICLEATKPGLWCEVQFDDAMLPAPVYLNEAAVYFKIPFGDKRIPYSPKAFYGERHLVSARIMDEAEIYARRNLALNPYDQHGDPGYYPHASANVETRGEMVFAARNTIDGIYANLSHGEYPYQSWGINRREDAELKLEFGLPVTLDEIRLTLRADFPHDSWWHTATVEFSDGSRETLSLEKTSLPQRFTISPRCVEWLVLGDLKKSDDPSPFPALTALEAWGTVDR